MGGIDQVIEGSTVADYVELVDDDDWKKLPEVGAALGPAGLEEMWYAVAKCSFQGKWAVGLARGTKNRHNAAYLALCLAIGAESPNLEEVKSKFPDFANVCRNAGI